MSSLPSAVAAGTPVGAGPAPSRARSDRPTAKASLLDAVADLRRDVAATSFVLPLAGVEVAEARRRQLLDQLDDHLLPRLRELSAPAVVVVAGSTGAGKSTLVNSVLGTEVSPAGVLRPTTRRPVLAHHPEDAELLTDHPLVATVDVVQHAAVPRGLALVDAPDLDSLLATNRSTAHRLLEAADLWVFVTTAARYGDALPWEVLSRAAVRGTSMAMVLNRVPADALVTVRGDLMGRLREHKMAAVPLFLVPDVGPHEGLLDAGVVAPILRWLTMVAGPDRARSVIARTQRGALLALRPWVDELAEAVQEQVDARAALVAVVDGAVDAPAARFTQAVRGGSVADGPVRSRWAALGGTGPVGGGWGSRRRDKRRAGALSEVLAEVQQAAVVVLASARYTGHTAVLDALAATDAPGAQGVLDVVKVLDHQPETFTTVLSPEDSAGDWVVAVGQQVRRLGTSTDRRVTRPVAKAVRLVGEDGVVGLVAAAAAGLGAARIALTQLIGSSVTHDVVAQVTDDLASRAAEQVSAGAAPARAVLAAPDLVDDAASRLRLRLAVLKALT